MNLLPAQVGLILLLDSHVRFAATGRLRYAVAGALALLGAMLFWEKAALVTVLLLLLTAFVLVGGGWRPRVAAACSSGAASAPQTVLPVVLFAGYYVGAGYPGSGRPTSVGTVLDLAGTSWLRAVGAAAVLGPWSWYWTESVYFGIGDPPLAAVLLGQLILVGLAVLGVRRRGPVSLLCWTMPALYLLGVFGDSRGRTLPVFRRSGGHQLPLPVRPDGAVGACRRRGAVLGRPALGWPAARAHPCRTCSGPTARCRPRRRCRRGGPGSRRRRPGGRGQPRGHRDVVPASVDGEPDPERNPGHAGSSSRPATPGPTCTTRRCPAGRCRTTPPVDRGRSSQVLAPLEVPVTYDDPAAPLKTIDDRGRVVDADFAPGVAASREDLRVFCSHLVRGDTPVTVRLAGTVPAGDHVVQAEYYLMARVHLAVKSGAGDGNDGSSIPSVSGGVRQLAALVGTGSSCMSVMWRWTGSRSMEPIRTSISAWLTWTWAHRGRQAADEGPGAGAGAGARLPAPGRGCGRWLAFSVVATHVDFLTGRALECYGPFAPFLARMDFGVTIFFLLSGFLLYRPFVAAAVRPANVGPSLLAVLLLRRATR